MNIIRVYFTSWSLNNGYEKKPQYRLSAHLEDYTLYKQEAYRKKEHCAKALINRCMLLEHQDPNLLNE